MTDAPRDSIRGEIRALAAYHVQDAAGFIKLDAMENPFDLPPELRDGLSAHLAAAAVNRYPDPASVTLTQAVRDAMGIPATLDVLLGNGSDEIIQMLAMACAKPGATVLSVEPAFVMFKMIATFCNLKYVGVPLRADDFALDETAMLDAIATHRPALTFIAYPNNPTGNLFDRVAIRRVIEASPGLVVIDEAYFAFSSESFLNEFGQYPNAVLMRTVSKLGLAGARLGILVGPSAVIAEINKVRLPYNINSYTQAAATYLLQHVDAFRAQTDILVTERGRLEAALDGLFARVPGAARFPSEANFVLVRLPNAVEVFEGLKARKILVKNTSHAHPLLHNTLRITIGSPAENAALLDALNSLLVPHYA